jgi:hypothetical protein
MTCSNQTEAAAQQMQTLRMLSGLALILVFLAGAAFATAVYCAINGTPLYIN